ncbi:M20/M25/M40 family metallo-hydrolase [Chloroflexales bacterium ZM16-3]|nr:M20/M25/M40 family metallo-hydrolase [Chloroflexales bacterium ZM16-3]
MTEKLAQCLSALCAQPTGTGQIADLRAGAEVVAGQLRSIGMSVRVVPTLGAPVVVAHLVGRSDRTLLLYHHYDTAPPGPWREWSHEPFQLAERNGALYARGVVAGKGPLAAHIQAIQAILVAEGDLPCGVSIIAEGHGMSGSQHLAETLISHADLVRADACLASQGERDGQGAPLCYSGVKGFLQVRLHARGGSYPLPSGMASILRNPLWRIAWALGCIKGDDEDIRIAGFYDNVEGPTRAENAQLRQITIDEPGRLRAWQSKEFLFGMSGAALVRAESTLPTCNLSAITCDPSGDVALVPASATAILDFQLVPNQQPEEILGMLKAHLAESGFSDVALERMPGGYPPAYTPPDTPFVQQVSEAGAAIYGAHLSTVPAGPLTLPLAILGAHLGVPYATVGLNRSDSAIHGPDEHVLVDDLARHGLLLGEILAAFAKG